MSYPFFLGNSETGTMTVSDDGLRLRFEAASDNDSSGIFRAYAVTDSGVFIPVGVMIPEGKKMKASKTHSRSSLRGEVNITHGEAHPSHIPVKTLESRRYTEEKSEEPESITPAEPELQATELRIVEGIQENQDAQEVLITLEQPEIPESQELNLEEANPHTAPPADLLNGWISEKRPERLFYEDGMRAAVKGMEALIKWQDGRIMLALPYPDDAEFPLVPLFCLSKVEMIGGMRYVVYLMGDTGTPYAPRK